MRQSTFILPFVPCDPSSPRMPSALCDICSHRSNPTPYPQRSFFPRRKYPSSCPRQWLLQSSVLLALAACRCRSLPISRQHGGQISRRTSSHVRHPSHSFACKADRRRLPDPMVVSARGRRQEAGAWELALASSWPSVPPSTSPSANNLARPVSRSGIPPSIHPRLLRTLAPAPPLRFLTPSPLRYPIPSPPPPSPPSIWRRVL